MFKKMTAKEIFKYNELESCQATFTKEALEYMRQYHSSGLELKYHDLTEDQFVGWCAAYGLNEMIKKGIVVGSYKTDKPLKSLVKKRMKKK